jgi:hypothetical protein
VLQDDLLFLWNIPVVKMGVSLWEQQPRFIRHLLIAGAVGLGGYFVWRLMRKNEIPSAEKLDQNVQQQQKPPEPQPIQTRIPEIRHEGTEPRSSNQERPRHGGAQARSPGQQPPIHGGMQARYLGQQSPIHSGMQASFPVQQTPMHGGMQPRFPGQQSPIHSGMQASFPVQQTPMHGGMEARFLVQQSPIHSGMLGGFPVQQTPIHGGMQASSPVEETRIHGGMQATTPDQDISVHGGTQAGILGQQAPRHNRMRTRLYPRLLFAQDREQSLLPVADADVIYHSEMDEEMYRISCRCGRTHVTPAVHSTRCQQCGERRDQWS